MPPTKKGSKKRKGSTKRVSKRPTHTASLDEDDGTQVESSVTPTRRKAKPKMDKPMFNLKVPVQLRKFCTETLKLGVDGIVQQFVEVRQFTAALSLPQTCFDANKERNRYSDVVCVDKSRVVLKWPPKNPNDYIHANWVEFKGEKKFICTQAPLETTIDDFWRLVWQEKCKAIVMLCELVEQNRKKCEPYYPTELNATVNTKSGLIIKNLHALPLENDFTLTTLEVTCLLPTETLTVKHYKWNNWPDRGVPQSFMPPMRLLRHIGSFEHVLIHCSAGIGRTGTIVGLHMAYQLLSLGEDLDLADVVKELRAQRHGSVQTDTQYVYMHRVLVYLAENKKMATSDETSKFVQDYDSFMKLRGG